MASQTASSRYLPAKSVCPLCENASAKSLLEVPQMPAHHVHPCGKPYLRTDYGSVMIVICERCGHIFNATFDHSSAAGLYAIEATTNAPVSATMLAAVRDIGAFILGNRIDTPKVLEIGCGVGTLARLLAERSTCVDLIEPNLSVSTASFNDKRIRFLPGFFPQASRGQQYDLIVCRQVLEHIGRPVEFLEAIRAHLEPTGEAYIEVPCADYIIDNASLVDFHYMHVHYFSMRLFEQTLARVGLQTVRSWTLKGGHDMGYVLKVAPPSATSEARSNASLSGLRERLDARWHAGNQRLRALGNEVALYGACSYSQALLGLYSEMQAPATVFDDTPAYRGYEVYHHAWRRPIVPPSEHTLAGIRHVIVASYLHDRSIAEKLAALGYSGSILTVRSDDDAGRTAPPGLFATT